MTDGYEGLVVVNYRLIRKVGEGGFGAVFLAEHEDLGRKAAVKILHPEYARHKEVVERFFREAKTVCAIGHRAIIDVQNFGRLDSGEPFYVMEYFDGVSLAEHVEEQGPLSLEQIESVFTPIVGALAAAHKSNIVHRDLKPENIMLRERGGEIEDVKLLDFGIAKLVDSKDLVASRTGTAMGTPLFMAPEQQRDAKNVDFRADVYSFGATVFHSITSRPPFMADNIADLVQAIHSREAPRLREFVTGASAELDAAIAACLNRDPNGRPETIEGAWAAIVDGLRKTSVMALADDAGIRSGASASYAKTVKHGAHTTLGVATSELDLAKESRSLSRVWMLAPVVFAAIAIGGFALMRAERGKTPSPESVASAPEPSFDASVPDLSAADASVPEPSTDISEVADPPAVETEDAVAVSATSANCEPANLRVEKGRVLSKRKRKALQRRLKRCLDDEDINKAFYRNAISALASKPAATVGVAPTMETKPQPAKVEAKGADCAIRRFSVVYNAPAPTGQAVRSALQHLKTCRAQVGEARYKQIQTALVAKL